MTGEISSSRTVKAVNTNKEGLVNQHIIGNRLKGSTTKGYVDIYGCRYTMTQKVHSIATKCRLYWQISDRQTTKNNETVNYNKVHLYSNNKNVYTTIEIDAK